MDKLVATMITLVYSDKTKKKILFLNLFCLTSDMGMKYFELCLDIIMLSDLDGKANWLGEFDGNLVGFYGTELVLDTTGGPRVSFGACQREVDLWKKFVGVWIIKIGFFSHL